MEPLFYSMQEIVIAVKDLDKATERLSEIFTAPADGLATEPLPGIDLLQRGIWIGNERIAIVADATGPATCRSRSKSAARASMRSA